MAYINAEKVKKFRQQIRAAFPTNEGWKISVRKADGGLTCAVTILEAPIRFDTIPDDNAPASLNTDDRDYIQCNTYHLHWYKNSEVLKFIKNICMVGNHDNSDSQSDYFDVGWYFDLHIGQWDKPFKLNNPKNLK